MAQYTFTKSHVALDRLTNEIVTSTIVAALDYCTALGSTLEVYFKASLSSSDETTLGNLVIAHSGISLPGDANEVLVLSNPAFSAKTVGTKKLYSRSTGAKYTVVVGANTLDFVVPYNEVKFNGLQICNGKVGESVNLKVLDTPTGTISGVPDYQLNQFGYSVNMPDGFYQRESAYDADLIKDLKIRMEYTATEARYLYVNYLIHELKT